MAPIHAPDQPCAGMFALRDSLRSAARMRAEHRETTARRTGPTTEVLLTLRNIPRSSQINRSNVSRLKIAWKYPTADGKEYLFNPIVVDNVMYVLAKDHSIVALDAATGKELWVHPTNVQGTLFPLRGINYWENADRSDRRLLFALNNLLQEIDARTGKSISQFGKDGVVDLRDGLGRDPQSLTLVQSTTPGRVFRNLIILGSATNEEYDSGPGDIRAYDVLSGQLVWSFHTVPHPGEPGYETWPKDAWKTVGGANDWSGMSLDESRGIVFVPTASPKYNFYGANRTGANLYGDCLLAINAQTGKLIWYFQMVHHDIWDYDNATPPQLLTVRHDGKMVDVVAQVGKEGFVWVFDRETGKPLWPIEERPVPHSDMPGEETWPTQPFPLKPPPFARQTFTAKDINPYMPAEERAHLLEEMQAARNQGMFTPPATQNTVEMPGNNGGANFRRCRLHSLPGTSLRCVQGPPRHAQTGFGRTGTDIDNRLSRGAWASSVHRKLQPLSRRRLEGTTAGHSIVGRYRSAAQAGGSACDCEAGKRPHAFVR